MKTAEEILAEKTNTLLPFSKDKRYYTMCSQDVLEAMEEYAQQLPSKQRIIEVILKHLNPEANMLYCDTPTIARAIASELSELSADADEKVTDEMIENGITDLALEEFGHNAILNQEYEIEQRIIGAKAMRDGKIKPDEDVPLKPINITVDRKTTRINRQFVNNLDILDIAVELGSIKQGEEDKYDVYKIVYGPENDLKLTNQMIDLYDSDMLPTEFYTVNNTPMIEGSNKY